MLTLLYDLRYAIRTLAANRGFTAAALLSLAIAIGANTSVFSVAFALLLRPLPYNDADRLAVLWNTSPGLGIARDWFSTAQYCDIKGGHQGFEHVAIAIGGTYNLTGDGEPERVGAVRVSSNIFPMLGAGTQAGRLFVPAEDSPGRDPAAVLSYGMWARRYGLDPNIVGKSISLNGRPYQVAGILTQSFSLPREVLPTLYGTDEAEIFLPMPLGPGAAQVRTNEDYNILAKLKPGVSLARAQAEMATLTARLRRDYPEVYPPNGGLTFDIVPLAEQVSGDARRMLYMLLGAVGCVLAIACANAANLLLSRAAARRKEIGVRVALGASRARIVRQLLTESAVLAVGGGIWGVVLSAGCVRWIHALGTKSVSRLQDIGINGPVLLFTLPLSLFSGILFGLAPAWRVSGIDLQAALNLAGRGSAGMGALWGRRNYGRRLLVIGELALSVVLLIGAGLLIRSFARLRQVPPGFDTASQITFDLAMSGRKYTDSQAVLSAYHQLWDRLVQLPGVTYCGGSTSIPLSDAFAWTPITIEGRTPPAGEKFINADARTVGGHYFQAMGIPLRRGRLFDDRDSATAPRAVIVDEHMAGQFWPNQDPLGKRIHIVELKSNEPWQTIVGVVGRVKQDSLDSDPRIAFYLPQTQSPARAMTVVVRSSAGPARLVAAIKNEIRRLDPDLPMYSVKTMAQRVDESLARRRFFELALSLFAGLALALAITGVYGVMAYLVNQGTREIGIRIALGATPRGILGLVLRDGAALAASGVAIGLGGAFALTRLMQSALFGVDTTDGLTFTAVALLLSAVALFASYIPASRASRTDAMASLRCE